MPRTCIVCNHANRSEIDEALVSGEPYRSIAKRFDIGESAVFRHQKSHLAKSMTKAKEAEQASDAGKLLDRVMRLLHDAQRLTRRAEKANELDTALRGIREVRGCLQLLGQVSGELKSSMSTNVNVLVALRGYSDDQVKQLLLDAGHAGWIRVKGATMTREERENDIARLLSKDAVHFRALLDSIIADGDTENPN
jgi:transposase-like protein